MEMTTKQIIQVIVGVTLFIFVFIFYFYNNQNNKSETIDIFKKAKFTIGEILDYSPKHYEYGRSELSKPSVVSVEYKVKDFTLIGKQYGDVFFTPSDSLNTAIKYLVVYDSINPSRFRIIFDSPISDSADLIKYIQDSIRILRDIEHYSEKLDKRKFKIIGSSNE